MPLNNCKKINVINFLSRSLRGYYLHNELSVYLREILIQPVLELRNFYLYGQYFASETIYGFKKVDIFHSDKL